MRGKWKSIEDTIDIEVITEDDVKRAEYKYSKYIYKINIIIIIIWK